VNEPEKESILIVEDEKIIALDLMRRLERFGYEVLGTAIDAAQAYEIVEEQRPDLVLMDIMLSGSTNGVTIAAELRRRFGTAIVFITAFADSDTLAGARAAEPYGYILKPFKERELFTTIDIALYKSAMERRLHRQERLFSAILHSINDGIVATDNDLCVQFMNPVAEDLTGWTEPEAQGKPIAQVAGIKDPLTGRGLFGQLIDSGAEFPVFFSESLISDRAGRDVVVDGSLTRIKEEGNSMEGFLLTMRDITEIKNLTAKVDYQASHDMLTGLSNREEFSLKLQEELSARAAKKEGEPDSLLVIDIDRFKAINDTCGSLAGDELLRQTASYIRDLTSRKDTAARIGGDEYAVILRGCDVQDAVRVAKRLQDALTEHRFFWNGVVYPITLSIGIVPLDFETDDIHGLLSSGDDACSMAREEGGNRINVFHPDDSRYERRRDEKQWIGRITNAAQEGRFVLYRQPIVPVDPQSRLGDKQEILIRMVSEDGGITLPGEFIPAAERYNLITEIDRWVIENSIRGIRQMADSGDPVGGCLFSINLSGQSLLEDGLADFIVNLSTAWRVPPSQLCFEITETAAIQNLSYATRFISSLKAKGFRFSLDDFGSGFSSFGYLQNLPVDYLKIDGAFVRSMVENQVSYTMVESINSMGHVMGLKTIAEFVVDEPTLERVRRVGVDYAQGYAISRPVPFFPAAGREPKA
jgi:diguanylate cyclase (GGDEF)-like protein/PAS domain S-box-containing protein